jgi:hypothetical protein
MARRRPTEPTVNPARGAVLVVVAVLVGLFLLRNGLDTSEVVTASRDDSSSDSGDTSDGGADEGSDEATDDGTETTEDTTPAARPPAEVPTIVLNGSGVSGAAGSYSEVLASLGYQLTKPTGGNAATNVPSTQVLYAEGFEQEAMAVAVAIGAPSLVPALLTEPSPGDIVGASVVVVLGPDLANVTPTTAAAGTDAGATDAATDDTTDAGTDGATDTAE